VNSEDARNPLPDPGPPFEVGDEVAFFPAEVSTPNDPGKLGFDYIVIDDIDEESETFGGHFVSAPSKRFDQDMNNIVRRTFTYYRWREAMQRAIAAGNAYNDPEEIDLRVRVLAEHPIHGGSAFPHPLVAARRNVASRDIHQR
jgi:hypothetical protein